MEWNRESWRVFPIAQQPNWSNHVAYNDVINELRTLPSLVFSGETRSLLNELGDDKCFILQIGDCAESFKDCTGPKIHNFLKILLQMSMVIEHRAHCKVVKIGRIAGQYAKPRSSDTEIVNNLVLPSYRGDIVNSDALDTDLRSPNPRNMKEAYFRSAATLNLMRAFIQGGYSNISNWYDWNKHEFRNQIENDKQYTDFIQELARSITEGTVESMKNSKENVYTSHEALLLDFEECFTRLDTTYKGYYDTSAHFLWIGDRTRDINGAHVEFLRGIGNPIGLKIGPGADPNEIVKVTRILNPENLPGKITLIFRLGNKKINSLLPKFLNTIKEEGLTVCLMCDPMHGNTYSHEGVKVRNYYDILNELKSFFKIVYYHGLKPRGVHLEVSSENVTECIGGLSGLTYEDLDQRYESKVDPRLNAFQGLEIAFEISKLLRQEPNNE